VVSQHRSSEPVAEAFAQATGGRPRPVALAMPWDVFTQRAPVRPAPPRSPAPPAVDLALVDQAAALLAGAKHPMIMVGGGARHAATEILELAEHLQAPVVSFRGGRGIVSDEHPLGLSCAVGFQRWAETDVLIGIGTRLELQWFRWPNQPAGLRVISVDIDPVQTRRIKPDISVVADAKDGAAALVSALRAQGAAREPRLDEFTQLKQRMDKEFQRVSPHVQFLAAIRDVLPRDGYFVEEICQAGFASYFAFPVYEPQHFITCGPQGTLGFGFPTALGVQAAHPGKPVVSITGDGGFMFGVQDLATAVQYDLNLVTIVFNNDAYGNVWADQQRLFEGRTIGSELRNPDFVALAEAFGAAGLRASTPDELRTVLEAALAGGRPAVIEVPVPRKGGATPWEFLMPGRP
jgi:acetolactate synthase-1/2/3 large subunit